jgi:uncharacterized protein YndB with AHSA1/START domain
MASNHDDPVYVYDIYIGAPIDRVWEGLTDGALTRQYAYGTRFQGTLRKGAPYAFLGDGDAKAVDGEILEVTPQKHLSMTWRAHWDEKSAADRPSRVTYQLDATGPCTTKLRVVHDDFDGETATYTGSVDGWPMMLSSLKTLLESGQALSISRGDHDS